MLQNYFTTAFRNLRRNPSYSIINVLGLALGIGCALAIYKIVHFELSFDGYHTNYPNIYRLVINEQTPDGLRKNSSMPHPMSKAVLEEFPEVREAAMTHYMYDGEFTISGGNENARIFREESGVAFVENDFFKIFDFEWLAGDPVTALNGPDMIVLSGSLVSKYFNIDPSEAHQVLGRTVRMSAMKDLIINGVVKDPPQNTDFPFVAMISYNSQEGLNRYYQHGTSWRQKSDQTNCWLLFNDAVNLRDFDRKLPLIIDKYEPTEDSKLVSYHLQDLSDLHYNTDYPVYTNTAVSYDILIILAVIGIFLLLTASINFVNLATAQSVNRFKEIGIRKVLGGGKTQVRIQFYIETFIITVFALLIALGFSEVILINLEQVIPYKLRLDLFNDLNTMIATITILIVVSFSAGWYPAFFISSFSPIAVLNNKRGTQSVGGYRLRRSLVIVQFAISQLLIIATIILTQQIEMMMTRDLGFEKGETLILHLPEADSMVMERMSTQLLKKPAIQEISFGIGPPISGSNSYSGFRFAGGESYNANYKLIDEKYIPYFKLELLAGRNLRKGEDYGNTIINRKVLATMNLSDPGEAIGKTIRTGFGGEKKIIGVVEDFHIHSLHQGLDYVFFLYSPRAFLKAHIKLQDGTPISAALTDIEQTWHDFYPQYLIDYSIYQDDFAKLHELETIILDLFRFFALVAIFIGCLGLYGLITFIANQKTKEIGIRKVLGATVTNILALFSREMVVLFFIAFIIAAPAAYSVMREFLSSYPYQVEIGFFTFMISISITFLIAILTIGLKCYRTATTDPVLCLRDE